MGIYSPSTNYALTNLISNKNLRSSSRLTLRGHSPATLTLLFHHAHRQATTFIARQHLPPVAEPQLPTTTTFLHLPYHPQDPNRHTIQQLWNSIVARPTHQTPLRNMKNLHGHPQKCTVDLPTLETYSPYAKSKTEGCLSRPTSPNNMTIPSPLFCHGW